MSYPKLSFKNIIFPMDRRRAISICERNVDAEEENALTGLVTDPYKRYRPT